MDVGGCVESYEMEDKVMVMEDMNTKLVTVCTEGVIGGFGVPGVDNNGACLIDIYAKKGMTVSGKQLKKRKYINTYNYMTARI